MRTFPPSSPLIPGWIVDGPITEMSRRSLRALMVILLLSHSRDEKAQAQPLAISLQDLGERIGSTPPAAYLAVRDLIDLGVIEQVTRGVRGRPATYRVNVQDPKSTPES